MYQIGVIHNVSMTMLNTNSIIMNGTCNQCLCTMMWNKTSIGALNCFWTNNTCQLFSSLSISGSYWLNKNSGNSFYFFSYFINQTTYNTQPRALAYLATVTASQFGSFSDFGSPSAQGDCLVNRSVGTYYNSGGNAPQYVQLELPSTYNISNVMLLVEQYPPGMTHHQLYAGTTMSSLQLVRDLIDVTYSGQWLNITFDPWLAGIRFLRLHTISSPSWVAWRTFLVNGI